MGVEALMQRLPTHNLVLGRISSDTFLGGALKLDLDLAEAAISKIGEALGVETHEAATGVIDVLTNNMLQAVRFVTVERGYDPRDFALVGYGGGGPMFVAELARSLEMQTAIVPPSPGVLSARGLQEVDFVQDRSRTILMRREGVRLRELTEQFLDLRESILNDFERQGLHEELVEF